MEVHAHSHTARKKWTHYLWEFLMLFLAVFCGFLAENIREHFVEKERAKEYAGSLVHDLEKDTAMIRVDIKQMKAVSSWIDSVANFLKDKKINDLNNRLLYYYTEFECGYRPYTWSRATLDQIKNSGSLRYFSNDSVIIRISAYDAFTKHMDEDYHGDEARNDKVSAKRNNIVDLNYPFELPEIWVANRDSLLTTALEKAKENNLPDLQLLTNNINEIKSLVNDYLIIKGNFKVRSEHELPRLIADAAQLISLLKKEYHLK